MGFARNDNLHYTRKPLLPLNSLRLYNAKSNASEIYKVDIIYSIVDVVQ